MEAMSARCQMRCKHMHAEALSYEEQRLAVLRKNIAEGEVMCMKTSSLQAPSIRAHMHTRAHTHTVITSIL